MQFRPCEICKGTEFSPVNQREHHPIVRCSSCGLERIDPQPTDAELAEVYGRHYYDAWGLHSDHDLVATLKRATFRRVIQRADALPRGSRVLDCGAATGFLLEEVKAAGYEPYGIELSEFGAKEIERKFGAGRAYCGHVEDARFDGLGDGAFAAVFMCDFIEHVRDPERVLARAFQLLAPGGFLALTTPKIGSLSHRAMRRGWSHYKVEHLFYFAPDNLSRLLERVGFGGVRTSVPLKVMNLKYIAHQMQRYPHPVLTPSMNVAFKLVPPPLMSVRFPVPMGELLAYARKPEGATTAS
jgi:2-polyprenyl-3-methyl-5-hydroxy-6-metoxy-1,4-benzoquinol methylase